MTNEEITEMIISDTDRINKALDKERIGFSIIPGLKLKAFGPSSLGYNMADMVCGLSVARNLCTEKGKDKLSTQIYWLMHAYMCIIDEHFHTEEPAAEKKESEVKSI